MNIDKDKQLEVIERTNQLLHSTETKRMLLRFQRGVVDLENNRFAILHNSEFVDKLGDYLYTLYKKDPEENILKLLEKIGSCACNTEKDLRQRAIFVLSVFIEKISQEKCSPDFLEAVSRLLVNWLQIETEFFAGFPFICVQLQIILQKMLKMGLWYQTENLIIVLSQIHKGIIQKNNLIRQTISKVHSCLAEEAFLKNLVDVYLDKKEDRRDIAQCLLLHFGSKAAAVLIQYLIDCQEKEKRFSLLEFIPTTGKVVVPVCDFCLKQSPPWYVIRNLIIIISRMEDPQLYEMIRPYLTHKDIRVQLQILNSIPRLGGPLVSDRLIEALDYINDELKQQVVVQLSNIGGRDVGKALCSLLEKRGDFAVHVRDELILTLCTKIKFEPSKRSIKVIKELLTERQQRFSEGDRILQVAKDALVSMQLKNTGNGLHGSHSSSPDSVPADIDAFKVPVATEEEFESLLMGEVPAAQEDQESLSISSTVSDKVENQEKVEEKPDGKKNRIRETILEAKKNLTDPDSAIHFTLWAKLYEEMTTEEFTAFHTALKRKTYQANELIIASGDLQAPLFLLDSGIISLVRNMAGEEVHLSEIGPGDLIGSDIFLTGEAWNLSLYAKKAVSVRIFDLELLLTLQVNFPNLAEKIFSYCSRHDVLQNLLRVLDDPNAAGTDRTQVQRKSKLKNSTNDKIQQGMILKKLKGGLCFSLPVSSEDKNNITLEYPLKLSVRFSSGDVDYLPASLVGTVRTMIMPGKSVLLARFLHPLPDTQYDCTLIEFLEAR